MKKAKLFKCVISSLALCFYSNVFAKEEVSLTLLSTSDIHGNFMPWDYALDAKTTTGSLTQIATLIKEIRAKNKNVILFETGDIIQGNSAELFQDLVPNPTTIGLNYLKYDVWTMGNHEFDFGIPKLEKMIKDFKGVSLAGNLYRNDGTRFLPSVTIIERDGIKVGVIGITTPMVYEFKADTDIFKGMHFRDTKEEIKESLAALQGKVDVIVGVIHMGMENENAVPNTGVKDIANAFPEFAAIFAGHMHKLHKNDLVNGVLIVEPNRYATHVSIVEMKFSKENGKLALESKNGDAIAVAGYESDKELEKLIEPFHKMASDDANQILGQLSGSNMVPKDRIKGIASVQTEETPLTDFFNKVMLHYSKADVVAHQIDRDNPKLDIGPISKKNINFNYSYAGGEVTVYKVTGKDLKDYMEWAVSYFNQIKNGDGTISFNPKRRASKYSTNDIFGGIKYDIDLSKPEGSRIVNLRRLDDTEIRSTDELKLGMNAYRMNALISKGGALENRKFEELSSTTKTYGEDEGTIRALSAKYIKEVAKGEYLAQVEQRWKIIGLDTKLTGYEALPLLVEKNIIEIPKSEDGKYTNVASINLLTKLSPEAISNLAKKAGVDESHLQGSNVSGDVYEKIYKLIK